MKTSTVATLYSSPPPLIQEFRIALELLLVKLPIDLVMPLAQIHLQSLLVRGVRFGGRPFDTLLEISAAVGAGVEV